MSIDESSSPLRTAFRAVRPFFIFRPHSGYLWLDFILLLIVSALHFTILPTLVGKLLAVDILTPWLLTYFIAAPFKKSLIIGVFAALIVETHSSAPAGMYLSLYWVALVTLWLVRVSLSWRHAFPWLVTFAAGEVWIVFSEYFVRSVNLASLRLSWADVSAGLLRVIFAVIVGMIFCRKYRIYGLPEDHPV